MLLLKQQTQLREINKNVNRKIEKHGLRLDRYRTLCEVMHYLHFWTRMSKLKHNKEVIKLH